MAIFYTDSGSIHDLAVTGSLRVTGSIVLSGSFTSTTPLALTASWAQNVLTANNLITVGTSGSSNVRFTSIKSAVDSITNASQNNTYLVTVSPGIYIEDTITMKSWITVKGDSSISTVVSASNPSASVFIGADQSMIIDMQVQGSTAPSASAVYYSSPTTPQTNAIFYVENVRFGTNYTNAKVVGTGSSGNCIMQCSNVKYGGYPFEVGFHVTNNGSGIGRMQLRNVTSTNGGVTGSVNQIFALSDQPSCAFIVNGCLLTRAVGSAAGIGFKVYNGGSLRLTGVNFQRWTTAIWAPQTGSAPSIDAIALNFENCTTDVLVEHSGSTGKIQGADTFLKTQINLSSSMYVVNKDPRKITVAKKGGDFTSVSASVAYITDSAATNRYVIEVGPGEFTEKEIDLTSKPYVSIIGSDIQATRIIASGSNHNLFKLGNTNEISFMTLAGLNGSGYSAVYCKDLNGFALAHKLSIYDWDRGISVIGESAPSTFYGEYIDINNAFTYGTYVSSTVGQPAVLDMENYYLFPLGGTSTGNYATGADSTLSLYGGVFNGDGVTNSKAIHLEDGANLTVSGLDLTNWDYGLYVPNTGAAPDFRIVGGMFHQSVTDDFTILHPSASGRFQGVSAHTKIDNVSPNFYWNFLDDVDGENDVTRKLSVTFADGTHTDATTLIFKGSPMGVMSGGNITVSSGLTITTEAGYGYLEKASNSEVYKRLDWNNTNLTLSPNTNNYIYFTEAGTLTAGGTAPSSFSNILLGRVVTNNTGIEIIDHSPYDGDHTANQLSKFNRDALGPVFASGGTVTENATPLKLNVTAGSYFLSENNYTTVGTSSLSFTQYYRSGSGWDRTTSTTVPNNQFDSGSNTLTTLSASAYTKHSLYCIGSGSNEKYFLVVGQTQYSSLVAAEAAGLPTPPTYFSDGVVPLASIYVRSGSANITEIQDIRPIIGFRAAGVNASATHGNLLGLSADDHTQYLLVNGTRAMAGNLDMGGNALSNISTLSNITTLQAQTSSLSVASIVLLDISSAISVTGNSILSGSLAQGYITMSTGSYSHAEGAQTTAKGDFSHAEGSGSKAYGNASHAEGYRTTASGSWSHTEGSSTIAKGQFSHAEGFQTLASGSYSHAEGNQTIAKGDASHAEGQATTSIGDWSHAEGDSTTAVGRWSHAEGAYTIASGSWNGLGGGGNPQTAMGMFNVPDDNSLLIIGNGISNASRSNIITVNTSSVIISGSLTVTGSIFGTIISSSYASTASYALNYVLNSSTSSMLTPYTLNSITGSMLTPYTLNSITSSMLAPYTLNSITSSMSVATASYVKNAVSSSFAATASYWSGSILNATSASYSVTASFAVSGGTVRLLTTTGTSGAATLTNGTLNIPQYTGGSGGGITTIDVYYQNIFYNN